MKFLVTKFPITIGIFAATLALGAHAAMAAPSPANPLPHLRQAEQTRPVGRFAAERLPVRGQTNVDVAQFVRGMLGGGPIPFANLARDVRSLPASGGSYDYSPSYDYSTAVDTTSNIGTDTAAAALQEDESIQEMNDTNAMTASMAAAEEENDAANAATLQTEINAGM